MTPMQLAAAVVLLLLLVVVGAVLLREMLTVQVTVPVTATTPLMAMLPMVTKSSVYTLQERSYCSNIIGLAEQCCASTT
jgi:uncharacterized protein (DUF983 family)